MDPKFERDDDFQSVEAYSMYNLEFVFSFPFNPDIKVEFCPSYEGPIWSCFVAGARAEAKNPIIIPM